MRASPIYFFFLKLLFHAIIAHCIPSFLPIPPLMTFSWPNLWPHYMSLRALNPHRLLIPFQLPCHLYHFSTKSFSTIMPIPFFISIYFVTSHTLLSDLYTFIRMFFNINPDVYFTACAKNLSLLASLLMLNRLIIQVRFLTTLILTVKPQILKVVLCESVNGAERHGRRGAMGAERGGREVGGKAGGAEGCLARGTFLGV